MDEWITTVEGDLLSQIVLSIPCSRCHAKAGQPCRKRDGESLYEGLPVRTHAHRITVVWVIYKIGYHHGRRDIKKEMNSATAHDQNL
jgi:hypothetical protein